jgi:hypothetical protein
LAVTVPVTTGSGYFALNLSGIDQGDMGSILKTAAAVILFALLGACTAPTDGGGGHPNLIIVREFSVSSAAISLDPSFGFSLYRGSPGVPPAQRAGSVSRAAAFSVADTVVQQLAALRYDVVKSNTAGAETGGRALIVTGVFREINEGRRRQIGAENARVAVDVEITYQAGSAAPFRMMSFPVDSQRTTGDSGAGRRGATLNAAAERVGRIIAQTTSELARLNHWPGATY